MSQTRLAISERVSIDYYTTGRPAVSLLARRPTADVGPRILLPRLWLILLSSSLLLIANDAWMEGGS